MQLTYKQRLEIAVSLLDERDLLKYLNLCARSENPYLQGGVFEITQDVLDRLYRKPNKIDIAEKFLLVQLANGPKDKEEIKKLAIQEGITEHTLRRARESLDVVCKQTGKVGKERKSIWSLPEKN